LTDAWTSEDLIERLAEFEQELRDAGMAPNTIATYVGRSETFVRWLQGEYSPRGPNETRPEDGSEMPDAFALLKHLGSDADPADIRDTLRRYEGITGYDASLNRMKAITGPIPDLAQPEHRIALIEWLRSWGCRHLRKSDTERTSEALRVWWEQAEPNLPAADAQLASLADEQLEAIASAYSTLATSQAAGRSTSRGEIEVSFGDTAAAKTLFAMRPAAVPPWDEPIRASFGWTSDTRTLFLEFLKSAADALGALGDRLGTTTEGLPEALARPTSTPAKIVDEYLWVRVTRGL